MSVGALCKSLTALQLIITMIHSTAGVGAGIHKIGDIV